MLLFVAQTRGLPDRWWQAFELRPRFPAVYRFSYPDKNAPESSVSH